jgi:glycosyltransferase involved in cell wall biosynthesis
VISTARPLSVLMVCAHEPTLDPRIRWEAEAASPRFDVTVLGFNREDESKPAFEHTGRYRIIRLRRTNMSALQYLGRFQDIFTPSARVALLAVLIAALPVALLIELAVRMLRNEAAPLNRAVFQLKTVALLRAGLRRTGLPANSSRLRDRATFIILSLRNGFAPAAVLFLNHIFAMPVKPDVVHCNDLDTLLVGVLAKKKFGCRVIYDAHEFWPVADSLCTWLDTAFFSLLERLLIGKVDAVVTVNPMLAAAIRDKYRLRYVYSVPNAEPWIDERPQLANRSGMAEQAAGRVKFLFQGRFTLARGIDEIIRGWVLVDGERAALFLRGPENRWRRKAEMLAAELGVLGRSVYFLEAVTEDELVAAADEADVGIVPYLPLAINERLACPNKLSQYLHAGLMVLTNDLPYVRSVVEEEGIGMFYNSSDLSTFADAVNRIVEDPELLRRYQDSARAFARNSFNWQLHGDLFLRLYAGEVDGEPAGASSRQMPLALPIQVRNDAE